MNLAGLAILTKSVFGISMEIASLKSGRLSGAEITSVLSGKPLQHRSDAIISAQSNQSPQAEDVPQDTQAREAQIRETLENNLARVEG